MLPPPLFSCAPSLEMLWRRHCFSCLKAKVFWNWNHLMKGKSWRPLWVFNFPKLWFYRIFVTEMTSGNLTINLHKATRGHEILQEAGAFSFTSLFSELLGQDTAKRAWALRGKLPPAIRLSLSVGILLIWLKKGKLTSLSPGRDNPAHK